MSTQEEKLGRFAKAVDDEVTIQINEILQQAEANRKVILEKANDESLYEAYDKIKEQIKKISNKYVKLVAKSELESKRKVLLHREKITSMVMDNVKNSLVSFTESPEYKDYLTGLLKDEFSSVKTISDITVFLSENDMKYSDDIKALFGKGLNVEKRDSIKLGGLCICYTDKGIMKDKTLDSALVEQKAQFNNSSCLKLD